MLDDLRAWQQEAIRRFDASSAVDFLVCATPGAGKTVCALTMAQRLMHARTVQRLVVVVPTDALREQWVRDAAPFGIDLMPVKAPEDYDKSGYHGCVVTYAQLAGMGADLLRRAVRVPTVALLDEIHHAGDERAWGDGIRKALEHATKRIALTGTPFRSDNNPIPFVRYDDRGVVIVDSKYEYGDAAADGVCRYIEFHAYDGEARWVDCGSVRSTQLGENVADDELPAVLETILHPDHDWMPGILSSAVDALRELRRTVPDAGGLVVADRQEVARQYAAKLEKMTGEPVVVALSDDKAAAEKIQDFNRGTSPWLVAVKMVSEGVDIKRLAVGVYASKTRTPLFFRQVVGRFVRTRPDEEINAKLFIPAVPVFMGLAKQIEDELRHQIELMAERDSTDGDEGSGNGQTRLSFREPLSASEALFSTAIFGGESLTAAEHAAAEAQCRQFGIPLTHAAQVAQMLRANVSGSPTTSPVSVPLVDARQQTRAQRERMLRREIKVMVGKVARRAWIEPEEVNRDLLKKGFPRRGECSVEQLEAVLAELVAWLAEL